MALSLSLGGYACKTSDTSQEHSSTEIIGKQQQSKLPQNIDFKSEATSKNINLGSSTNYQISSSQSWCRASQQGSTLKVSVELNDDTEIREAQLTLKAGEAEKKITVRQIGTAPAILVNQDIFSFPASGGKLDFEITTNVQIEVKLPEWITAPQEARAMRKEQRSYIVQPNKADDKRTGQVEILQAKATTGETPLRKLVSVTQQGLNDYSPLSTSKIPEDEKIPIVSGHASSFQSPDGIEKSFDGDYTTLYHSSWANSSDNYYPITLTYNLGQVSTVDYFVYYPRTNGGNGRFHTFDLEYSQDGSSYTKIDSYTLDNKAQPTKFAFKNPVQAKSFRFKVTHGHGDGKGFASCAEMEFYKRSSKSVEYRNIFADDLCTTVRPDLTEADIQKIDDPFFRNLAYYIKHGKYNTDFRVASYKPYQDPAIVAGKNKTYACSRLDNPTGIYVKAGEDLIAFVGDTHGFTNLSILVQNLDKPGGDGFNDPVIYSLTQGFNKIRMTKPGLVYVMYHVGEGLAKTMQPIKIHFATGHVNGYYDSQNPKLEGKWKELLAKAEYKYFDVLGKYSHLTFETDAFRRYTPEGREIAKTYDSIVHNEWILHGYYKYNRLPQNRMYLHVMYHAFMYATWYHTAYVDGTQKDILDPNKMRNPESQGAAWGPSHELGHVNQVTPGLKWRGMTEVTVNIPSEYITTYVFKQPSRLQAEKLDFYGNNRYTKAFSSVFVRNIPFAIAGSFGKVTKKQDDGTGVETESGDVFCNLVPFWQLELYFGKVLGRTPRQSADGYSGFYPDVYQYLRTHDDQKTPGTQQTEFPFVASTVAKRDLTRFFERWGFFREVDMLINDYAKEQMTVTKQRADEVKGRIKTLGFEGTDHLALEYITDNNAMLYKNPATSLIKGQKAQIDGNTLSIRGWNNTVAFEIYDENNQLIFVADASFPSLGSAEFSINKRWNAGYTIKAVSAGNSREVVPHS